MQPDTRISEPARRLARLERRLEILGKICRHDLPNKLVVIRGLANFLLEESGKLGPEGQDYVRRLGGAAERALDMMQSLKTLLAVNLLADQTEDVDLQEVAEESLRETRQLFPRTEIDCRLSIQVRKARCMRRTLHKAMAELLRYGLSSRAQAAVEIGTRATAHGVEVALAIGKERIPLDSAASSSDARALENRVELLIVRELADTWGGAVRFVESPGTGMLCVLCIPG